MRRRRILFRRASLFLFAAVVAFAPMRARAQNVIGQLVNVGQINGVKVSTGTGPSDSGTQRVVIGGQPLSVTCVSGCNGSPSVAGSTVNVVGLNGGAVVVVGTVTVSNPASFVSSTFQVTGLDGGPVDVDGYLSIVNFPSVQSVTVASGTVTTTGSFTQIQLAITVHGGAGSAAFSVAGELQQCSTVVPSGAQYDFEIDGSGSPAFPVFGNVSPLTGNAGVVGPRLLSGGYTFNVSGASVDGTYNALCVVKQ